MMAREVEETLAAERDALLERVLRALRFDTTNPPGQTEEIIQWLADLFDDYGVETEVFAIDPVKPNLLARVPGQTSRTLLFNGHVDTVPYDLEEWTYDPLGERVEDRIYGRGATDMKGPLMAMVQAVLAHGSADEPPPVTLELAIVSDEEVGGEAGISALLEADRLAADGCIIGETTCSNGRHSVTVADRGSIWLTLRATGSAAHGSRPVLGSNAIDRLWEAIQAIRDRIPERQFDFDAEIRPIIDESIEYYRPEMGEATARDLFEHATVNLGIIRGGETINSVPRTAGAKLDIRVMAGVHTPTVLADIRESVDEFPAVSIEDVSWSFGTYDPIDDPIVEAVAEEAERAVDTTVYRRSATGGGDAKQLRSADIPTVEFAIGTDTVHANDEYITTEAIVSNATIYSRIPYRFAKAFE